MKLLKLKTGSFGALSGREFAPEGKPAVIFGANEAGKTTFTDAVCAALYGLPRANSSFGREFYARYGDTPAASAEFSEPALSASSGAPPPQGDFPQELFRALLVIRAGEARVQSQEKRFMQLFTARVMSGGEVDVQRALGELRKIYDHKETTSWGKRWTEENKTLADLRQLLSQSGDMETLSRRKFELARELQSKQREHEAREAEVSRLERELQFIKLDMLRQLQRRHDETQRGIAELGGIDQSLLMRYNVLQEEINALARKSAEKTALFGDIARTLEENSALMRECEARLAAIAPQQARGRLMRAEAELSSREEVCGGFYHKSKTAALAPAFAALAAGAAVYAAGRIAGLSGMLLAAAASAGAALAAYAALRAVDGGRPAAEAKAALIAAQNEFQGALSGMGPAWKNLSRAQVRQAVSREDSVHIAQSERHDVLATLLSRALSRRAEEEAALAQISARLEILKSQLESGLKALGARNLGDLAARIEKLEYLHRSRDEAESQITLAADITRRNIGFDLDRKIRERERQLETLPPPAALRTQSEAEADMTLASQETQKITAAREQLHREYNEVTDSLSRLEGSFGMPVAEVFAKLKNTERAVSEISLWRQAAEETFRTVSDISRANMEMLRNCVENAAPAFSRMTGGAYTGLSLAKSSPFEAGAITARHKDLGERPAEWLSSGAADMLWLAIRMAMASSGYKTPAFMLLDEPFSSLDRARASNAMSAIADFGGTGWQVIILTKDETTAKAAATAGFLRINL
ncbi:MAG: AAA family ATPase [Elusimicrobiales bacterium]